MLWKCLGTDSQPEGRLMSVAHLAGKRTGRPKGVKSTPPWKRDALWAYRHFDDADAVPPSEFARRLRDEGRERPASLLAALVQLDGQSGRENAAGPEVLAGDAPARGVMRFSVPVAGLVNWAMGHPEPLWLSRLPEGCDFKSFVLNRARRRIVVTLRHTSFPAVPPDHPVPVVECE
jgi:hypothetical protein